MPDDTILEVGAIVDLSKFLPQIGQMAESTKAATGSMASSFVNLGTTSTSALTSTIIASGQVTRAVAPIGASVESTATKVTTGAHQMEESVTGLGAAFKELAVTAVESLSEVGAKMSETAERSRLGVGVMESAFFGFSELLGAGIAVGFAAHFLDETSRVLIELGHLNVATGISVETLSGLRAVAQQTAVPFETFQLALNRMQRAQVEALRGNKQLQEDFADLGITLAALKSLKPEDLFFALADGVQRASSSQAAENASMQIFSRGAYTMLPLLRQHGSALRELTEEQGKHTGVTHSAVEAAEEWHRVTTQLAQTFQSFMIPVIQIAIPVIKTLQTAFEAMATVVVASIAPIINFGKVVYDTVTGNWKNLAADSEAAVHSATNTFRDGFNDIRNIWKAPLEAPEVPTGSLEDLKVPVKTGDILTQWREQLDQLRDAQTGFHELSKADEATFWQSKLEIARGNSKLYASVYHEFVTAERAARRESLTEELSQMEQRVAAERTGSSERVTILQEEVNHLRTIGAEETSEYRRIQQQLVTAQREEVAEEQREFVHKITDQLSEERNNATAKLAILNDALGATMLVYGQDSEAYRRLIEEKRKVDIQLVTQQHEVQSIQADERRAGIQTQLEIERSSLSTQQSIGLISASQRIALDRSITQQEISLERSAIEEKMAIYKDDPVAYERARKELLAIDNRYNKLMAAADDEELKSRLSRWRSFSQQISGDFSRSVGEMIQGQKSFGQALAVMWDQMVVQWAQALAKMLAQFITAKLTELLFHATVETQKVAATQASETAQTAAATTGTAQRSTAGLAGDVKSIGSAAATGAAHAFKWVMEEVPFPANIALAPAIAAATFAGILAFKGLASAQGGALLDRDMLVAAHANELVIPATISTGLQNVVAHGGFNIPPALTQNFATAGSTSTATSSVVNHRNVTVNPTVNVHIHGGDASQSDSYDTVVQEVRKAIRRGALGAGDF